LLRKKRSQRIASSGKGIKLAPLAIILRISFQTNPTTSPPLSSASSMINSFNVFYLFLALSFASRAISSPNPTPTPENKLYARQDDSERSSFEASLSSAASAASASISSIVASGASEYGSVAASFSSSIENVEASRSSSFASITLNHPTQAFGTTLSECDGLDWDWDWGNWDGSEVSGCCDGAVVGEKSVRIYLFLFPPTSILTSRFTFSPSPQREGATTPLPSSVVVLLLQPQRALIRVRTRL